jgi:hypothetical protein
MNADRIYDNPGLEARRLALLERIRVEDVWCETPQVLGPLARQIEQGFQSTPEQNKTRLTGWVGDHAKQLDRASRDAFRMLLLAMEERGSPILDHRRLIGAMSRLARFSARWLRTPAGFFTSSRNANEQFSELARYLLARWPVPKFFDEAWSERGTDTQREWFIHLGAGGNLRTAADLPFPLTKLMAHHALLAPDGTSIVSALRWGQVRALGGSDRLARAIMNSSLRDGQENEPFWLTVVQFFVANPMLNPYQVVPIVDWIQNQRFIAEPRRIVNGIMCGGGIPQPGLNMKGRTVESVLRQVERWHLELNRSTVDGSKWPPCGVPGYERVEGNEGSQTIVRIDELLTAVDLQSEGRAMRHCVASYTRGCASGIWAVYSLKVDDGFGFERRLTVQVAVASKRIVQARGRFNALPSPFCQQHLRSWAAAAGLTIVSF